ncbi:S8 family peptidase [Xanthobacteraceae bacterium A53D]
MAGVSGATAQVRKVPEALMTSAASGGHQRVIVLLATPQQGGRQEAARQPERYVESALAGTAQLVRGISDQPMVVAEVNSEGLARLERDQSVRRVVPDTLMTAFLPESTKLIHAPDLWSKATRGSGVSVAILDTGVQRNHPFFAKRIVAEACFSSNSPANGSRSLCPNGQAEQIGAGAGDACDYRAITANCVHGTHVAGIAAGAGGRLKDVTLDGVAPAANIVAVQVFSRFEGEARCGKGEKACINAWTSDVIKGLLYVERIARQQKVAAINLSLGGGKLESACDLQSAYGDVVARITKAGIAVVAAAGNNAYVGAVTEPGCIGTAITVGAVDKSDKIDTRYSNTADMVDLVAPGTQILSAAAGSYHKLDGTSMAAPHVAGLIALLKSKHPEATVDELLAAISGSGQQVADARTGKSFPLPNAGAALAALEGGSKAAPVPAPSPSPQPQKPVPDPRLSACGPVCVDTDKGARRVIFVLANRDPVGADTLKSLRAMFGSGAKVEDIGDGKLAVELPEGTSGRDVDKARKDIGDGTKVFPDTPLQTLEPGERIMIR